MFEAERQVYEYHINILTVKMKVKFPCRMKIQHLGSLLTGQAPVSDDNRYIFNQQVILKDQSQRQCFQLTINLLTDKGAKYIAGVIKLYHSELIRSEGERLVLSLAKCIDSEAFCQVKVEQVVNLRGGNNAPYDRKSTLQREIPYRNKQTPDLDLSPLRNNYNHKVMQSKSQYQFPLHNNGGLKKDWDTKSKSRLLPPQSVYNRPKNQQPRINYVNQEPIGYPNMDVGMMESGGIGRQKALEAEVYKQGYQKLKQKYKKQAQVSKQQLNKRLALQNSENNLKLQIMRLKLRIQENDKAVNQKNSRIKEMQTQIGMLQQKEVDNGYLRQQINKKDQTIRSLEQKVRVVTRNLDQLRDMASDRTVEESNRIKQLQIEMENMRVKMENRQKELERQNKTKIELLHQRDLELVSKTDNLQRQRKNVADLQKALQNKNFQLQKLLQNQKNNCKNKIDEQRSKNERLQKEIAKLQEQKKDAVRELQQYRTNMIKLEYDKKIFSQELESMKSEFMELKPFRQKYNQLLRDHRSSQEEKTHLERQLERTIQNKQMNLSQINKQFQDQLEYYKRINRELDEKAKTLSNKLIQIQGQLQLSRNQQDKLRRSLEGANKEAFDAKDKEKSARKALKNKEQEMLSMESEQATMKQKLKSIDQINKLQLDKTREEAEKYRIQLQSEIEKTQQLMEGNTQMNMELNRLKIKLQYAEERSEKDGQNLKEKQGQVESLIKDYEQQISSMDQTINSMRQTQKDLTLKLQRFEVQTIKSQQKIQKSKKQIKIFEERCNNYESTLKGKGSEIQVLLQGKDSLQKRLSDTDAQLNQLKSDYLSLTNERNKVNKMNQLLQDEIKKSKGEIGIYSLQLNDKQKNQEQLRNVLKGQKQQYAKLELKLSTYKKQVDRYRETLFDTIQKSLMTISLQQQNSIQDSRRSLQNLINKKPTADNSFAEGFNLITNQTKEIKQFLSKQNEQIKQIQRENQRLQEQISASTNKCQYSQVTLKKQIDELQAQLHCILQEKEEEAANSSAVIGELNEKINHYQMIEQELNTQIEEMNFTNNSLKMDYEALNDQNTKKIANLRKLNTQLQEKVEYQALTISELDERCSAMQTDIDNLQATIENDNEVAIKKDKLIEQLKQIREKQQNQLDQLKKQRKQLGERSSEFEMHLNTQREIKEKTKILLEEEEGKASQLKIFISNLMKQKQIAIKNQLERSESIITLESALLQANKQIQLLKQENDRVGKGLQSQKQINKKITLNIKELENEKKDQKSKHIKTQQKLRQKEKQLINKDEQIKKIEQKYQKNIQKCRTQLRQIQEQLQLKNNNNLDQTKDSNQRIIQLENQLQKKTSTLMNLQTKMAQIQQQLYAQRQKGIHLEQANNKLRTEGEELKAKINQMDGSLNQIADQSKQKEERLFEFSGKIYTLELKLEGKEQEINDKLEMLNSEWVNKYDAMCEEYEQRLELVEKERDYFKGLSQEKDRDISRLNSLIKSSESSQSTTRKSFEQKIKKLEEQKLSLFSIKNSEIQRLIEENKSIVDTQKSKESQLRRITNELEVARKTITNLDQKSKQYDQKIKGINKMYQTQLQQLKKKDLANKNYKQAVNNQQWNTEREVKKSVQSFIKNFLEISEDKNSQRIIQLVRGLQKNLLQTLSAKLTEK